MVGCQPGARQSGDHAGRRGGRIGAVLPCSTKRAVLPAPTRQTNDMDRSLTTGDVARVLGTTGPRVIRAADRLFPTKHAPGVHRRFTNDEVVALAAELGAVPFTSHPREDHLLVLAALSHRPLGLRSARAVAAVAGMSPTTASRTLTRLQAQGIVYRSQTWVIERRPQRIEPWRVDFSSEAWWRIAQHVSRVVLPAPAGAQRSTTVPRRFWHHFWNVDPAELSVERDGKYIAGRILQSEDPEAIAWMASAIAPDDLRAASGLRSLDPSRRVLAENAAAAR